MLNVVVNVVVVALLVDVALFVDLLVDVALLVDLINEE